MIIDFFDRLKRLTSGYASFEYESDGYNETDLIKLTLKINEKEVKMKCLSKWLIFLDQRIFPDNSGCDGERPIQTSGWQIEERNSATTVPGRHQRSEICLSDPGTYGIFCSIPYSEIVASEKWKRSFMLEEQSYDVTWKFSYSSSRLNLSCENQSSLKLIFWTFSEKIVL